MTLQNGSGVALQYHTNGNDTFIRDAHGTVPRIYASSDHDTVHGDSVYIKGHDNVEAVRKLDATIAFNPVNADDRELAVQLECITINHRV